MAAEVRDCGEEVQVLSQKENPKIDLERCYASCSSSSSSMQGGADLMVKIELDAARALADFAQLALLEREKPSGDSSRKWGSKGRRSTKRVKNEYPGREWVKNIESSKSRSSSLAQWDCSVEDQRQHKQILKNMTLKAVKGEDSESSRPTHMFSMSYMPQGGGKSKHNLTEAEKEARRLRRVLANRESARQTIRRRQAMCDDLTRKAADLAWDNESMKREKELVLKKYESLKDKNKYLKAQMASRVKSELEEVPEEIPSIHITPPKSPCDQPALSSENPQPFLLYPRPSFRPHIWPSIVHHLNPVHTKSIPLNASTLQDPITIAYKPDSLNESENHLNTNVPRIPYYILPCPWFFPLSDNGNVSHSHVMDSSSSKHKQDDISVAKQLEQSSTKTENLAEANSTDNLPENSSRHSTSEDSNFSNYPNRDFLMPTPLRSVKPSITLKYENKLQQNSTPKEESISPTASHVESTFSENIQGSSICSGKKLLDVAAAAEARKRRKELTKMKNLNRRQFRLGS